LQREATKEWVPIIEIPKGDRYHKDGLHLRGITHLHHFYEARSLYALSKTRSRIEGLGQHGMFWFTSTLPWCSRENRLHLGNYFGKKGGVITSLRGVIYIASLSVETNVFERLRLRLKSALVENPTVNRNVLISTQSATQLKVVPNNSIDYIFIDPPFGWNLMYSELNFFWEGWLRILTAHEKEAIVNVSQRKRLFDYLNLIESCLAEGYRVLKPGRWMTVEFHNSSNAVWNAIQEALQRSGFVVADVRTLDKRKGSFTQVNYAHAVKQDLVISVYKPNGGLEDRFRLIAGTDEGVWDFVRSHLRQLPVFVSKDSQAEVIVERQNYLLFDRMVAFHVQRGVTVPLSASEFYVGLAERFSQREGMYFLPEQVVEYDKKRMTVKEVLQLELFVKDEASSIQWLHQQLINKPQTFQELHPQFLKETAGWEKYEKPLELSELLEQNFLIYDGKGEVPNQVHSYLSSNFKELRKLPKNNERLRAKGKDRWYVPDPNKAGDLEKLRERSLLKEFEEYRTSSQKRLKVFRLEAVRTGFKKAWQERDYSTIITVANKIPENVLQEDPKLLMWYDQAVTRTGGE